MGEPTLEDTAPEESAQTTVAAHQPMSATWAETWVNVVFPTLFGMVAGAFWQASISPQLTYGLPNPPQGGLLIMMLFSPSSTVGLRLILNRGGSITSVVSLPSASR